MPDDLKHPLPLTRLVLVIAVAIYLIGPVVLEFTPFGFLGYRAAPDQLVRADKHEVLQSTRVCKADDCDNVPDVWRDKQTGAIYRRSDFLQHRRAEAGRLGWTWFAYSLIGCLGVVGAVAQFDAKSGPKRPPITVEGGHSHGDCGQQVMAA
jgi:hypothetical protein